MGDVDGDGDDDVLACYRGSWWVGLSDGSSFSPQRWAGWSDKPWQHVSLVNLDADGDADLLANLNGAWWVRLSTSTGGAGATSHWAAWNDLDWQNVTVGDFDGDGRDDIAARHKFGWWVARSNGAAFETSLWGTWQNVGWTAVAAVETSQPPVSSPAALTSAQVVSEHDALAMLWSSGDDDEFAAALLAV